MCWSSSVLFPLPCWKGSSTEPCLALEQWGRELGPWRPRWSALAESVPCRIPTDAKFNACPPPRLHFGHNQCKQQLSLLYNTPNPSPRCGQACCCNHGAEMCERDFGSLPSPGHGRVWALPSISLLLTVGVQSPMAGSWGGFPLPSPPASGGPSESQELARTPVLFLLHPVLMSEPPCWLMAPATAASWTPGGRTGLLPAPR